MTHLEKQQAAQAACHPDNITLLAYWHSRRQPTHMPNKFIKPVVAALQNNTTLLVAALPGMNTAVVSAAKEEGLGYNMEGKEE